MTSFIITSLVLMSLSMTSLTSAAVVIGQRGTCKDSSPNCEKWATEGMCREDPDMEAFMGRRCPFACDVCSGVKKRRARAIAELRLDAVAIDAADAAAAAAERSEERRMNCEDFSPKCE